jgi:hypothetical protein
MTELKYAVGGDHTPSAVTELGKEFSHHVKWQASKRSVALRKTPTNSAKTWV